MKMFFANFSIRKIFLAFVDGFIVAVSALISNFIMFLWGIELSRSEMLLNIVFSVVCCFGSMMIYGAYTKLWRYFNSKDYLSCVSGITIGIIVSYMLVFMTGRKLPVMFIVYQCLFSILGVCAFRYIFKCTFIDLIKVGHNEAKVKCAMIIGAGQACRIILKEINDSKNENRQISFNPVCIIDDDSSLVGKEISGVPVVGTTNEINKFVEQKKIEQIIFAIPSCMEDERKRILDICSSTKLPIKIIPFISDLIFEENTNILNQIRDIKVEDLLGREPIKFDNQDIKNFISGKICMVTGGGGSIGSELVRQIARYEPKQIIIVDIYENNAYDIQQELVMEYEGKLNLKTLIASVRDYQRMNQIFEQYKPQILFHAAAHKHVPLMEASPMEAIKNNVIGTFNMATLSQHHQVEKFVMISTDKAVNPTNVMGASKRCCEMIVQYLSQQDDGITEFVTTRFGNVLGSNGSVIPLFKRQIEQGKAVTVTHPDVIRYFMTIPEAVNLVMEAAAIANGGEIFVLDMGKPVKIVTLAENLIRMYGKVPYKDVEIKFTGLRPGEKLLEELLMDEEGLKKTSNKLIFIGNQIEINEELFINELSALKEAAIKNDVQETLRILHKIVPTFVTPEEFNKKILMNV